jgi:uncharacterized membrane protein
LFSTSKPLINHKEQDLVIEAIRKAEAITTGEIRVFVESHCAYVQPLDRAIEIFGSLAMHKTQERNAVLLYIAIKDRQYAIYGDEAIHELANNDHFWTIAAAVLLTYLRQNEYGEGIAACVNMIGEKLATHFPIVPGVVKNELPDEIVFGK